jgi:hypothetical protein
MVRATPGLLILLPGKDTVQRGGCNVDAMQTHDARVFLKMSFMTRTYS